MRKFHDRPPLSAFPRGPYGTSGPSPQRQGRLAIPGPCPVTCPSRRSIHRHRAKRRRQARPASPACPRSRLLPLWPSESGDFSTTGPRESAGCRRGRSRGHVPPGASPNRRGERVESTFRTTDTPGGPCHGPDGLHQGRADRHHRVDRRLARHPLLALPGRGQGDQERRPAHRPRVADRAVRLPGRVRRHLRPRQAHADHRQHPGPDPAQVVEVRLRVAVQGRRLLRHHAPLHRQQVGNVEPRAAAGRRLRHGPAAGLRRSRIRPRRRQRLRPARISFLAATSLWEATTC